MVSGRTWKSLAPKFAPFMRLLVQLPKGAEGPLFEPTRTDVTAITSLPDAPMS